MTYLESLAGDAALLDVFQAFPQLWRPVIEYHERLLRQSTAFSAAESELIAAYVSGLNRCEYCRQIHAAVAERLGVPKGLVDQLLEDVDRAPVSERLKAALRYARQLTLAPAGIVPDAPARVLASGCDSAALHHLVSLTALFNFMNRVVLGLGIEPREDYVESAARRLASDGYLGLLRLLEREGGAG
ncbi:MAG TPA: peroxidase [Planctomycetaceae bacterium]|nr:peroxidase [Planctomycetaceae bacterium]HIQ21207.1 peroxidase [Planctomycetota bacterium]